MPSNWELGLVAIRALPRCGAKARSAGGRPCRQPVVAGKTRCHYHGGSNPGPISHQNGLRTGQFTSEAIATRKATTAARRAARERISEPEEIRKPMPLCRADCELYRANVTL